jgi:cation transport protein ChaC
VKAIEAEGFRDAPLHQLALMLHDSHPSTGLVRKSK